MAPFTVTWLAPPSYDPDRALRVSSRSSQPAQGVRGGVLCLLAPDASLKREDIQSELRPFWGRVWSPRVLVVPPKTRRYRLAQVGRLGIDAVLDAAELNAADLRRALTDASDFKSGVVP
jgi:hypothetical protein